MRSLIFARRNALEILRDPLTLVFGLGFPLVILGLLTLIQAHIPVSLFELPTLTPGITVFGLAFMALFSSQLVAKDRGSAFLQRLYTTPLTAWEYVLGYVIPLLPIALLQSLVCCLAAMAMGLAPTFRILLLVLGNTPAALFFISLGLALGSVLNEKQVGGVCGALLTNLTAWLSGVWFDLNLIGGGFKAVCECLPFFRAVQLGQKLLSGADGVALPLGIVCLYAAAAFAAAAVLFFRQMKK